MSDINWRTQASHKVLLERALMLKNIRAFFDEKNIIEVETPLLSHASTTDPHLDSLQSKFRDAPCFLNTSPEYAMKRLLASWGEPIFQICKAFRDDELGVNHNPEFTLLEWYRPGYDMTQLMAELAELVSILCSVGGSAGVSKKLDFEMLSYQQAFEDYVGINPHLTTVSECHQAALAHGIEIPRGMGVGDDDLNDWMDWLLTQLVLPQFQENSFTFLYDYPAAQCSLAKIATNEQQFLVAKRFELFFGEIELANGFHELTDAQEQLQRFKLENQARQRDGKKCGTIDTRLIAALDYGLPECSGVAMGLDRLLMALTETKHIERVISFSWQNA
jgi:lysyl-tRNA synthetase class 2